VKCNGLEVIDSFPQGIFFGGDNNSTAGGNNTNPYDTNTSAAGNPAFYLNNIHPNDVKKYRDDALINGLQISSQLARNSEQYYDLLTKVFTTVKLGMILMSENPIIRSKGCNLIGNLCR
jgi:hypothetical protein